MLCTGEAVGVCTSVFETQQGDRVYRLLSLLSVFEKSCQKAMNNNVMTSSEHILNNYPRYRFQENKKRKGKRY